MTTWSLRFRDHQFTEAELPAKLKEWSETPDHHFFYWTDDNDLFVQAFGPDLSITARGQVLKKYGAERTAEIAAAFGTTLTGKAGKVPEGFKHTNGGDYSANPSCNYAEPMARWTSKSKKKSAG